MRTLPSKHPEFPLRWSTQECGIDSRDAMAYEVGMNRQPTPEVIFETLTAYQNSAVLQGAIELDIFTAVTQGADQAESLARNCSADPRGMRILCDYLTIRGFLSKSGDRYSLTPVSAAFLDRNSPTYMGGISDFLRSGRLRQAFADVAAAVRKGGTVLEEGGTVSHENPIWQKFARGMAPVARFSAELLADCLQVEQAGPCKILDVAAGHGLYGITLARRNPQAEVFAADWPGVLQAAAENAQSEGVSDRHHLIPGSAFETDFGEGYDLVLLTNFLHHFGKPACVSFLEKVRRALKPGGRAATLEFVPNDDRITPAREAAFSLTMLCTTPAGEAYTFAEFDEMFRQAGFRTSEIHALEEVSHHLIISHV